MTGGEQLQVVIFYEWCRGSNPGTTVSNITDAFGTDCGMNLECGERSGRHSVIDGDGLQLPIKSSPDPTAWKLATTVGCTRSNIELHLHDLD
ncbi:unnamed protein product [Heligmosomoides polygyrus]|uniref:CUB domain-containing protein n=1 Tax=Heligmosomoides polygyrus TaxID=6339 RepID=A0A183F8P7_HELPZ|nr:unnamed protein product [Heligmosomoides polygyrus]